MAEEDVTLGELVRRLDSISGTVKAIDERTRTIETAQAVMGAQLSGHIEAQSRRTTARDMRCTLHETELAEIEVALAGQAVRVGVMWSALGLAAAAMVTSIVGVLMGQ